MGRLGRIEPVISIYGEHVGLRRLESMFHLLIGSKSAMIVKLELMLLRNDSKEQLGND